MQFGFEEVEVIMVQHKTQSWVIGVQSLNQNLALFLSPLADFGKPVSFLRSTYPKYTISKNKIQFTPDIDIDYLLAKLKDKYKSYELNTIDGLKIEIDKDWIHLRRSNTEPIIRVYSESNSKVVADNLSRKIQQDVHEILSTGTA